MLRKTIYISLLCLLGLAGLPAANAQTVAKLEADTIALGDQTTLAISRALNYPSTDMLGTGGIVALEQTFDTATHTQYTVLTCFEPGEHYIHLGPDDSLLLVVTDVEIDSATAQLRDIAPIVRMPYTFWEIFRWVLLALGIAAIAFAVWWLVTHRQQVQQMLGTAEPVDTRNPQQRALDNLEQLRQRQLWQAGKTKEYHTELTDIVRIFIEESTAIRATEMTSDETVAALEDSEWKIDCAALRDIFTTADLVKFAKREPLPHEHDRSMSEAVDFVGKMWEKVKPVEEEAASNE